MFSLMIILNKDTTVGLFDNVYRAGSSSIFITVNDLLLDVAFLCDKCIDFIILACGWSYCKL